MKEAHVKVKRQLRSNPAKRMPLEEMLAAFHELRFAVLATADEGKPYTSLITYAMTPGCRTLIFATSRVTSKYRNIRSQPAVSILLDNRSQNARDLQNAQAVTLLGTAKEVRRSALKAEYRGAFLNRHPELADFIDEPGTSLIAITVSQAIHVTRLEDVSCWP